MARPSTPRRWLIPAALVLAAVLGWVVLARTNSLESTGFGTRTTQVGSIQVNMTALTLNSSGADFRIEFTTHSGSLDVDPVTATRLVLNGNPATTTATWDGPGPGGHHRSGTLHFPTPVPPGAAVELRLTGLPEGDAIGSWTAP